MLGEEVDVLELARGGKTEYEYLGAGEGVREEFEPFVEAFVPPQSTSLGEGGEAVDSASREEEEEGC